MRYHYKNSSKWIGCPSGFVYFGGLYHIFFGDAYKVNQDLDFNGDGAENEDDVLRLLYNIFFGNDYPLS